MKILFYSILSSYTFQRVGGAETSIRLLAEKLAERGHKVYYLTLDNSGKKLYRKLKIQGVTVILFSTIKYRAKSKIINRLILICNRMLYRYIINIVIGLQKMDIVYAFYELKILTELINLRKKSPSYYKFKIVMRMAGIKWWEDIKLNNKFKSIYNNVFNNVDYINYISNGVKRLSFEKAKEMNISYTEKNFVADIGVDIDQNNYSWQGVSRTNPFQLLMATRFSSYQKRQDILINAVNIIDGKIPLMVVLIGDGPEKDKYINLIESYQLQDTIKVYPFLEQIKTWELMTKSDLLCHPCDYEGLSKIIIESMSIGLPVLSSNVLAPSDYIIDGYNGFLADNTAACWAEKIIEIYNTKLQLNDVSKRAKEFVQHNYDATKNILTYEKAFKSVIDGTEAS